MLIEAFVLQLNAKTQKTPLEKKWKNQLFVSRDKRWRKTQQKQSRQVVSHSSGILALCGV